MEMRKNTIVIIIILLILLLIPAVLSGIKTNIRYSSPLQAFENTAPKPSTLIGVLKEENLALVLYKEKKNVDVVSFSTKNTEGWSAISTESPTKKTWQKNGINVALKEVEGNYCIIVIAPIDNSKSIPAIIDSEGSQFQVCYDNMTQNSFLYGFYQCDDDLPDNYGIYVGDVYVSCTGNTEGDT